MKPRAAPLSKAPLVYFALLAALVPASAAAFDWGALGASCEGVKLQNFSRYLEGAKAWEALQARTRDEIQVLSSQVCPEYLQSANGAAGLEAGKKLTLEAYIARHTSTFQHAGETTGQAREGEAYLTAQFDRINGIHASVGWDFASSSCGTTITAARKHYSAVAATVQALAADTGRKCAQLSQEIAARGPQPGAPAALAPGSPVPSGASPRSDSRITGQIAPASLAGGGIPPAPVLAPLLPQGSASRREELTSQAAPSQMSLTQTEGSGAGPSAFSGRSPASLLPDAEESDSSPFAVKIAGRSGRSEEYVVSSLLAGGSQTDGSLGPPRAGSELEELVVSIAQLRAHEDFRSTERLRQASAATRKASSEASVFELVRRMIRKRQLEGAL